MTVTTSEIVAGSSFNVTLHYESRSNEELYLTYYSLSLFKESAYKNGGSPISSFTAPSGMNVPVSLTDSNHGIWEKTFTFSSRSFSPGEAYYLSFYFYANYRAFGLKTYGENWAMNPSRGMGYPYGQTQTITKNEYAPVFRAYYVHTSSGGLKEYYERFRFNFVNTVYGQILPAFRMEITYLDQENAAISLGDSLEATLRIDSEADFTCPSYYADGCACFDVALQRGTDNLYQVRLPELYYIDSGTGHLLKSYFDTGGGRALPTYVIPMPVGEPGCEGHYKTTLDFVYDGDFYSVISEADNPLCGVGTSRGKYEVVVGGDFR